jgi:VIT1/CCC1 family predicted Fe2+/Mn2+ transporter
MEFQLEKHYANKLGLLDMAVLRAAEGVLFITNIVIVFAAGNFDKSTIILAGIAGMIAGAMSIAACQYFSVSSEGDIESAYLLKEKQELEDMPEMKLQELAEVYVRRGVSKETAFKVAVELTHYNALAAHAQDELGITKTNHTKPLSAAFNSFGSFVLGAILPIFISVLAPINDMIYFQYGCSIAFLIFFGAISARTGGVKIEISVLRICFWGTIAMGFTALIGYFIGTYSRILIASYFHWI